MSTQSVFAAKRIALIGVPSSAGARLVGQEHAPQSLRTAGLAEGLNMAGHEVVDLGDLPQVSFFPDTEEKDANVSLLLF